MKFNHLYHIFVSIVIWPTVHFMRNNNNFIIILKKYRNCCGFSCLRLSITGNWNFNTCTIFCLSFIVIFPHIRFFRLYGRSPWRSVVPTPSDSDVLLMKREKFLFFLFFFNFIKVSTSAISTTYFLVYCTVLTLGSQAPAAIIHATLK